MKTPIYFDYAAATPVDSDALVVLSRYAQKQFYNPSAAYTAAHMVRHDLENARLMVAGILGAKPQEIVFTAGGTEANNLAIDGVMQLHPEAHMVVSGVEHESILEPAARYDHSVVGVDKKGFIDLQKLKAAITENTVLISIMYANNEIGTVQSIRDIAAIIADVRVARAALSSDGSSLPLYFHTDACQAANYLNLQVARLGVDMMTLNGGKIYAPKQSGCLYVAKNVNLVAQIRGGGQERSRRSGTENVGASIAFATMLQKVQADRKAEDRRLRAEVHYLFATLSQKISDITLNGDKKRRLPNNLNITIGNVDGERLLMELDEAGLMVATGSACTASSDEPSHVLKAIGLLDKQASASLRITLGRLTTAEEVRAGAEILSSVITAHQSSQKIGIIQ